MSIDFSIGTSAAQRRKEKLRHHIIEIGTELYFENGGEDGGFDATTIEAIAERADISVRSFFRYFESKADVIFLDKARALSDLALFIGRRLATDPPINAIVAGSLEQVESFTADPLNADRLRRSILSGAFHERMAVLQDQQRRLVAGLIEPHLAESADRPNTARVLAASTRMMVDLGLEAWARRAEADPVGAILGLCDTLHLGAGEVAVAAKVWSAFKSIPDNGGRKPPRRR